MLARAAVRDSAFLHHLRKEYRATVHKGFFCFCECTVAHDPKRNTCFIFIVPFVQRPVPFEAIVAETPALYCLIVAQASEVTLLIFGDYDRNTNLTQARLNVIAL